MKFFKKPPSQNWYCWFWVLQTNGEKVRVKRCTNTTDLEIAEKVAAQLERQEVEKVQQPEVSAQRLATLQDAVDLLIKDRKQKLSFGQKSASTVAFYEQKTAQLLRVMGNIRLSKLTPKVVDDYSSYRHDEGVTQNTIHKEFIALRCALKLAKRHDIWTGDISRLMPIGQGSGYKPRERWLPPGELHALMGQLHPDRAAFCAFIVATSARWGEALRAQRGDVYQEKNGTWMVRVRGTKTAASKRIVPMVAPWQVTLLEHALGNAQGSTQVQNPDGSTGVLLFTPWLCGNASRDMREACSRAGIERCNFLDLRRTHASYLYQAGVPLELISKTLGHTTTHMVQTVYGRMTPQALATRMNLVLNPVSPSPALNAGSDSRTPGAPPQGHQGDNRGQEAPPGTDNRTSQEGPVESDKSLDTLSVCRRAPVAQLDRASDFESLGVSMGYAIKPPSPKGKYRKQKRTPPTGR